MNVVITGAAGFLGSKLADALLQPDSPLPVARMLLTDTVAPAPRHDSRVSTVALDITTPAAADHLITPDTDVFFHLAAIVSGHAEADFDLGIRVNFDATRTLLEAARHHAPALRFVYTSTVGVFGGNLPPVVDDLTVVTPQNSYGVAKAMSELLVSENARRGFVDSRLVRLPTVSVRGGEANRAVTSFASGVVREPLRGKIEIIPVDEEQRLWITSPRVVVQNLIHAAQVPADAWGQWRGVNLPGISVSVREMVQALREVAGDEVAALVRYERDEFIARIVGSLPPVFDNTRALALGFVIDENFTQIVRDYIKEESKKVTT